ncbi:hypothetical protein [Agromyces ramosus]|uniref:HD domain-containing protein n=1 Tax=Agromyces ramosus TaxID=33879 RepID=A0ABU0R713_9MICO|nr:hypothetical protein [Agromyces ramosus]MDQ0893547.1 hypothetical protein [Agromyces ramosus]
MTTHADDQPLFGFGTSGDVGAPPAGRRSADHGGTHGGTLRPRRVPAPEWGRHPSPRDVQRYYLCSEEPSGEFVEVIIPVTDNGRRRYFATSDGERLTEVDEDYFVGRGEGNARSLLELDAREMAELQAELNFVRPVLGRDPLAEVAAVAAEAAAAEAAADASQATDVADVPEPGIAPVPPPVAAMQPPTDPMPVAAVPAHIPPPPQAPDDSTVEQPAVENDNDEDENENENDDDEETIEETDVVMGTSVFEGVEPAASVPPFAVAAVSATAPVDGPAHAAPAEPPPTHPSAADEATPAVDAAAQVSLAKGIAFVAHRGQLDRIGAEYIDHPGRVAERFDPLTEPVPTAVAWLHDVLEDTAVTAHEMLEAGVLPEVVELVQVLTRTADVADDEYYARIRRHPIALRVKLADLDDNTAPWRVRRLDYDTQVRLAEKYRHAREVLGAS